LPILNFPSSALDSQAVAKLPSVALAIAAGLTNLDAIVAQDLVTRDWLYTLAIMCAPVNREAAAARLNQALVEGELYEVLRFLEAAGVRAIVEGDVALAIADRESARDLIKTLFENDWLGHIAAGYVLRWIISHSRAGIDRDASLAGAVRTIEVWCRTHRIKGGGAEHVARNIWPKYKPVSHLWAAYYVCQDAGINILRADGFQKFVSTAQWLLENRSGVCTAAASGWRGRSRPRSGVGGTPKVCASARFAAPWKGRC